jgi:pimeloyl-ACP methyl ester carboxylesterase
MTIRHKKRLVNLCIFILLIPLAGSSYLIIGPGRTYLRAASLLQRIADGKGEGKLARFDSHPVDEQPATVQTADGPIPARLYVPRGVTNPPGMVILHGVHHLGIEEPRLIAFSRAISSSGIVVLTPELKDIADYHVSRSAIDTIGAAAKSLSAQLGGAKVGVMGLSFSGGLSLLAAVDPRYADSIGFVVSIGGHDDLARVCEFFATDKIAHPDRSIEELKAHEYGALVLVYSHPEDFFSAADLPAAREALRLQLWENEAGSRKAAAKLSPAGRARMEMLLDHKKDALATELMDSVTRNRSAMLTVSPHGNLAELHVPVLLLHGAGDTVIPASETLWLEKEVPSPWLRAALITPLLSHVDVSGSPPLKDQWAMVAFIAELLRQSDSCARQPQAAAHANDQNDTGESYHVRLKGGHRGYAG